MAAYDRVKQTIGRRKGKGYAECAVFNDYYSDYEKMIITFVEAALQRANIHATEIYMEDMDDTHIVLCVKELDVGSGEQIENHYTIRYFDDDMAVGYLLLLYVLYRLEDYCSIRLGWGVCKVEGCGTLRWTSLDN